MGDVSPRTRIRDVFERVLRGECHPPPPPTGPHTPRHTAGGHKPRNLAFMSSVKD